MLSLSCPLFPRTGLQPEHDSFIFNTLDRKALATLRCVNQQMSKDSELEAMQATMEAQLEEQRLKALGIVFQPGLSFVDIRPFRDFLAKTFLPAFFVPERCIPVIVSELKEFGTIVRKQFSGGHIDDIAAMAIEHQLSLKCESDQLSEVNGNEKRPFTFSCKNMVDVTQDIKSKTRIAILVCFNEIRRSIVEQQLFIEEQRLRFGFDLDSPFVNDIHLKKMLGSYSTLVGNWDDSYDCYENMSLALERAAALFTSEPERMEAYLIGRAWQEYEQEYKSMMAEVDKRFLNDRDKTLVARLDKCSRRDFAPICDLDWGGF